MSTKKTSSLEPSAAPSRILLTSLADLAKIAMAERFFDFTINRQQIRLRIRPLDHADSERIDAIDADIMPPRNPAYGKGDKTADEFLFNDPAYKKKRADAIKIKRVMAIEAGVVGFTIPGEDMNAKVRALYEDPETKLPIGMIESLWSAIIGLTSNPVEAADFTSTAA